MLIYARIILVLIILSAIIYGILSVVLLASGEILGVAGLLISGIIIWLAYTNYVDAGACAASRQ